MTMEVVLWGGAAKGDTQTALTAFVLAVLFQIFDAPPPFDIASAAGREKDARQALAALLLGVVLVYWCPALVPVAFWWGALTVFGDEFSSVVFSLMTLVIAFMQRASPVEGTLLLGLNALVFFALQAVYELRTHGVSAFFVHHLTGVVLGAVMAAHPQLALLTGALCALEATALAYNIKNMWARALRGRKPLAYQVYRGFFLFTWLGARFGFALPCLFMAHTDARTLGLLSTEADIVAVVALAAILVLHAHWAGTMVRKLAAGAEDPVFGDAAAARDDGASGFFPRCAVCDERDTGRSDENSDDDDDEHDDNEKKNSDGDHEDDDGDRKDGADEAAAADHIDEHAPKDDDRRGGEAPRTAPRQAETDQQRLTREAIQRWSSGSLGWGRPVAVELRTDPSMDWPGTRTRDGWGNILIPFAAQKAAAATQQRAAPAATPADADEAAHADARAQEKADENTQVDDADADSDEHSDAESDASAHNDFAEHIRTFAYWGSNMDAALAHLPEEQRVETLRRALIEGRSLQESLQLGLTLTAHERARTPALFWPGRPYDLQTRAEVPADAAPTLGASFLPPRPEPEPVPREQQDAAEPDAEPSQPGDRDDRIERALQSVRMYQHFVRELQRIQGNGASGFASLLSEWAAKIESELLAIDGTDWPDAERRNAVMWVLVGAVQNFQEILTRYMAVAAAAEGAPRPGEPAEASEREAAGMPPDVPAAVPQDAPAAAEDRANDGGDDVLNLDNVRPLRPWAIPVADVPDSHDEDDDHVPAEAKFFCPL